MEERNWKFNKLPDWLRWVLALPVSIIGGLIIYTVLFFGMKLSGYIMGYSTNGILYLIIQNIMIFGAFLYVMYLIVPKQKLFVVGIFSGLFALLIVVLESSLLFTYRSLMINDIIVIITGIVLLVFAVYAFIHCKEDEEIEKNLAES